MQVIVVGAGIGGLSAGLALALSGHSVQLLESASTLAEIGAGVQLTPNATKAFWKWGLGPDILEYAVLPSNFQIREIVQGEIIGRVDFTGFMERYGGPYIVIHRADIHRILHKHGMNAGVNLSLSSRVVKYDLEGGCVQLADGQELTADLVVVCDGIHSFARGVLNRGIGDGLEKSGWAAYRKMVPVDALKCNPLTERLTRDHNGHLWIGDDKCIMAYLVKGASMLNIVLSHPDDVDTTGWTPERYEVEIKRFYGELEPTLKAVQSLSHPGAQNWPVYQVRSLPTWTSKSGKSVLMGDAAHAMPFYLSMGVSMAVEDAEALAECISLKDSTGASLEKAMKIFEKVRKPRAEAVRDASLHAGNVLQMRASPEREARDRAIKYDGEVGETEESKDFYLRRISYGIADQRIRDWCYGYNVVKEVQTEWL